MKNFKALTIAAVLLIAMALAAAQTCFTLPANDPNVCSGNGQCVGENQCQCNPTFTGDRCNGREPGTAAGGDGTASDVPFVCFSQLSSDAEVCTGNGQCVGPDQCQCNEGFTGQRCEVAAPRTNPDGTAADVEQLCFSLPASNPLVCTGNGQCVGPDQCQCNAGFTGDRCNGVVGQESGAGGTGASSGEGAGASEGQSGTASDVPQGQESGAGQPGTEPSAGSEQASSGQESTSSGFTCFTRPANDPNVCSGNGQCVGQDQCQCNPTFTGDRCNGREPGTAAGGDGTASDVPFVCFSQLSSDAEVCTGNGQCVGPDQCQCNEGFTGQRCEVAAPRTNPDGTAADVEQLCFSLPASNPLVCTGNGQCVGPDQCQCNAGFTGDRCNGRLSQEGGL